MASEDVCPVTVEVSTLKEGGIKSGQDGGETSKTSENQKTGLNLFDSREWYDKTPDNRWVCRHCDATFNYNGTSGAKRAHVQKCHPELIKEPFYVREKLYVHVERSADPSLEHFTETPLRSENTGIQIYECVYCDKQLVKKYHRFREHLAFLCTEIPPEKRQDYITKYEARQRKRRDRKSKPKAELKRPHFVGDEDTESDDDFDNMDLNDPADDKELAVNILTRLFSGAAGGDGNVGSKKSFHEYTNKDLDRELKELNIKINRLKSQELEEKAKFCSKFSSGFSAIAQACQSYLDVKKRNPSGFTTDPSVILQAAYEESINGNP